MIVHEYERAVATQQATRQQTHTKGRIQNAQQPFERYAWYIAHVKQPNARHRSNTQTPIRGSSFCARLPVTSASKILKELYSNISYSVFKYIIVQQPRCKLCIVSHLSPQYTSQWPYNTADGTVTTPVQKRTVHFLFRPQIIVATKSFPRCCVYCLFKQAQYRNTTQQQNGTNQPQGERNHHTTTKHVGSPKIGHGK